MAYNLEHFEKINDSLYLAKNGLGAAMVNDAGAGVLEVGISTIDREYKNTLRFSALGKITQNPQTKLLFHDHFSNGSLARFCYGGATYSYYHFHDAIPITEEHVNEYVALFHIIATGGVDNTSNTSKTVQGTFKSLKNLSLSMHRLAILVAKDYVARDTWKAVLPIIGRDARLRRDSAYLNTDTFDSDSSYRIAEYKTDFKNGTVEKEPYSSKEKQLQLSEPKASI